MGNQPLPGKELKESRMEELNNALKELEDAVERCRQLSLLTIILSLPEFRLDFLDWLIWNRDQRN